MVFLNWSFPCKRKKGKGLKIDCFGKPNWKIFASCDNARAGASTVGSKNAGAASAASGFSIQTSEIQSKQMQRCKVWIKCEIGQIQGKKKSKRFEKVRYISDGQVGILRLQQLLQPLLPHLGSQPM